MKLVSVDNISTFWEKSQDRTYQIESETSPSVCRHAHALRSKSEWSGTCCSLLLRKGHNRLFNDADSNSAANFRLATV
jgi:hypothetical protein